MAGFLDWLFTGPAQAGGFLTHLLDPSGTTAVSTSTPALSPYGPPPGLLGNSRLADAIRGGLAGLAGSQGRTGLAALGAGAMAGAEMADRRRRDAYQAMTGVPARPGLGNGTDSESNMPQWQSLLVEAQAADALGIPAASAQGIRDRLKADPGYRRAKTDPSYPLPEGLVRSEKGDLVWDPLSTAGRLMLSRLRFLPFVEPTRCKSCEKSMGGAD
jgi:hypothetical protein